MRNGCAMASETSASKLWCQSICLMLRPDPGFLSNHGISCDNRAGAYRECLAGVRMKMVYLLVFLLHTAVTLGAVSSNELVGAQPGEFVTTEASTAERDQFGRAWVGALAHATNISQRVALLSGSERVDPSRFDVQTRESLRKSLEAMIPECDSRTGYAALILLARIGDERSRDVVRAYVHDRPLEIPETPKGIDMTMRADLNVALALTGDHAALDRICRIKFTGFDKSAVLGASVTFSAEGSACSSSKGGASRWSSKCSIRLRGMLAVTSSSRTTALRLVSLRSRPRRSTSEGIRNRSQTR